MQIVLWMLRLEALLVAVMASGVVLSELPDHPPLLFVLVGPVLLLAYAWSIFIALLWMRRATLPRRRHGLAAVPLMGQLTVYLGFWAMRGVGFASFSGTTAFEVTGILAFLAFLFGFPAALPAGLVFRRTRALLVTEALGPPVVFLVWGVAALLA